MDYQMKVNSVKERIVQACGRSGRDPEKVTIIGVTKYVGIEETHALRMAGIQNLGENRLQVAMPKVLEIKDQTIWHFIGHLQTNKVKEVIPYFSWIHSLDRMSLAKEIQKQAEKLDVSSVSCLVQVNISGEQTKGGLSFGEVAPFLESIAGMDRIQVCGLMTMAPFTNNPEEVRPVFHKLRQLRDSLYPKYPGLQHLSMGMSGDFEVAVEEGATMVRLGSILVKP